MGIKEDIVILNADDYPLTNDLVKRIQEIFDAGTKEIYLKWQGGAVGVIRPLQYEKDRE